MTESDPRSALSLVAIAAAVALAIAVVALVLTSNSDGVVSGRDAGELAEADQLSSPGSADDSGSAATAGESRASGDSGESADSDSSGDSGAARAHPQSPSFGGPDIPEIDEVEVVGEPLPEPAAHDDLVIGLLAPQFTATSLATGTPVTVGAGRARVIGFFAHWCPHCQRELGELVAWLDDNELPPGAGLIAVSTAAAEDLPNYPPSAWFGAQGWPLPVLVDDERGSIAAGFGVTSLPAFVVVDRSGVVIARSGLSGGPDGFDALFAPFAR